MTTLHFIDPNILPTPLLIYEAPSWAQLTVPMGLCHHPFIALGHEKSTSLCHVHGKSL